MKNIPADDQSMRNGGWQPNISQSLGGKTLSLFGLGKLGAMSPGSVSPWRWT